MFERFEQHNLKLKASKCELFETNVSYMGRVVSEDSVETEREDRSPILKVLANT